MDLISALLMLSILLVIVGGFANRLYFKKGIGREFTRCMLGLVSVLVGTLLRLKGAVPDLVIGVILAGRILDVLGMRSDGSD